eukprot:scaffold13459_cov67-Phaeocystis_antarctica.AAC.4
MTRRTVSETRRDRGGCGGSVGIGSAGGIGGVGVDGGGSNGGGSGAAAAVESRARWWTARRKVSHPPTRNAASASAGPASEEGAWTGVLEGVLEGARASRRMRHGRSALGSDTISGVTSGTVSGAACTCMRAREDEHTARRQQQRGAHLVSGAAVNRAIVSRAGQARPWCGGGAAEAVQRRCGGDAEGACAERA